MSLASTLTFTVTDDDTAEAVGSGSLPVLGTPRLLAWAEAATCAAIEPSLPDGGTSVGTRVVARAPGRLPRRRRGRGHRRDGVRRRAAAPLHRRRSPHRRPEADRDRRGHPGDRRRRAVPQPHPGLSWASATHEMGPCNTSVDAIAQLNCGRGPTQRALRRWGASRGWLPSCDANDACDRSCPWCPPGSSARSSLSNRAAPSESTAVRPR